MSAQAQQNLAPDALNNDSYDLLEEIVNKSNVAKSDDEKIVPSRKLQSLPMKSCKAP